MHEGPVAIVVQRLLLQNAGLRSLFSVMIPWSGSQPTEDQSVTGSRILLVEDDESLRLTQEMYLTKQGFQVTAVGNCAEALAYLTAEQFHGVLTDLRLGDGDGLELLSAVKERAPETEVIVITGHGSVDTAVEAMKAGAYDYLTKPVDPDDLVLTLNKALERLRLRRQVAHLTREVAEQAGFATIVAVSAEMRHLMTAIDQVARNDATVLIEGESGTGKELIARYIHHKGLRAAGPFVALNCGALQESLLESELFGHVKGSFTGAVADRRGLFEAADGGTLLLDEVSETGSSFQVKLLRVLEDGRIRRVGGTGERRVNVRIIAATNRNIGRLVQQGNFRQDLYYRLKVIPLFLPPLRKRPVDIRPLAEHFLTLYGNRMGRKSPRLSPTAIARMEAYPWPGNVRELANAIERALIFSQADVIEPADLPLEPLAAPVEEEEAAADFSLASAERIHLRRVLEHFGWNQRLAARALGIGYNTLWRKMTRYRILRPEQAPSPPAFKEHAPR
jgi:DNA-binding NtrC family response regulator